MKKQYRRRRAESSDSEDGEEGEISSAPPTKIAKDDNSERKRASDGGDGRIERSNAHYGREERERNLHRSGGRGRHDDGKNTKRDGDRGGTPRDRDRDRERDRDRDRDREREKERMQRQRDRDRRDPEQRGSSNRLYTDRGRINNRDRNGDRSSHRPGDRDWYGSRTDRGIIDARARERGRGAIDNGADRREREGDRGRGGRGAHAGRTGESSRVSRHEDTPASAPSVSAESSTKSRGIFSYIGGGGPGRGSGGNSNGDTNSPARPAGSSVDKESRPAKPNSAALSAIIRGDRRTNLRMDREQFDGAQTRLRSLAPEGDEVKDKFSTGCRPDLTGKKDHPFQCNVCPMSFPMATQLSDHLERSHDIVRHPSLITPNKSLSVGLAADVHSAS